LEEPDSIDRLFAQGRGQPGHEMLAVRVAVWHSSIQRLDELVQVSQDHRVGRALDRR
jgi:hypothetical protein